MTASTSLKPARESAQRLDAYGKLLWGVESGDGLYCGNWLACFDAVFNPHTNTIDYHVIVYNNGSVDVNETGSIRVYNKIGVVYLKSLPTRWNSIGVAKGFKMNSETFAKTEGSWGDYIDSLVSQGISPEDVEEVQEQSPDFYTRHIS